MSVLPTSLPTYFHSVIRSVQPFTLSVRHIRCHGSEFLTTYLSLGVYGVMQLDTFSGSDRIVEVITIGCQWSSAQPTTNSFAFLWGFECSVIVYDLPFSSSSAGTRPSPCFPLVHRRRGPKRETNKQPWLPGRLFARTSIYVVHTISVWHYLKIPHLRVRVLLRKVVEFLCVSSLKVAYVSAKL
ncbi:hypothetical protein VTN02DRAFT_403 [Thermoascus thermophilus]